MVITLLGTIVHQIYVKNGTRSIVLCSSTITDKNVLYILSEMR